MGTLNINPVLLHKMKHSQGVHDFGFLYNWYAANNANLAPEGWHVPTKDECDTLLSVVGVDSSFLLRIADNQFWNNIDGVTNEYNFSAIAAGYRDYDFTGRLSFCFIATRTSYNENNMSILYIDSIQSATDGGVFKFMGTSVRLIKNDSTNPGSLTDIDGNIYPTVKIGSQVWTAADWRCTKMNDGTPIPLVTDQTAWTALTTPGYCIYP
jgi:uncharacterized protein (TIGR02145 family)